MDWAHITLYILAMPLAMVSFISDKDPKLSIVIIGVIFWPIYVVLATAVFTYRQYFNVRGDGE